MSAPSGPATFRSNTRIRGSAQGLGWSKDIGNGAHRAITGRRAHNGTTGGNKMQRRLQPPAKQSDVRSRSWEKPSQSASATGNYARKATNFRNEPWRNAVTEYNASYKARMSDLYQTLKVNRETERKEAIKHGFLADPDKPTSLANAITPVGTCQDMCPEFERVERIVQLMVDGSEKEIAQSGSKVPCEALMVKRFRRSAAGYDEQLPSDIRPPAILKKTLDYLINDVVGGPEHLSSVHKFVWDRTRGIRNDFSIQQVTKTDDLRIAIECFERIARFHILSLHQLSGADLKDNEFDHHQEREQLNNTLLSLIYYYDDSRHKLASPNEAEFRAYCIIFEIQDQRPDLEDRVQFWPRPILKDPRVQTALKLYAAAGNTSDEQGPLRPRTTFSMAQANASGFWALVTSNAVSYLTACVAEIYFNSVRAFALEVIWKAYKGKRGGSSKVEDWTLRDMTVALGFDEEEQTAQFCEEHGFVIGEGENDEAYVDLSAVAGGHIGDSNPRRKQLFSGSIVERKRLGRTLPAVIDGITASEAQAKGYIEEVSDAEYASDANTGSIFFDGESDAEQEKPRPRSASPHNQPESSKVNPAASPFRFTSIFGKPSSAPNPFAPAGVTGSQVSLPTMQIGHSTTRSKPTPSASKDSPQSNAFQMPSAEKSAEHAPSSEQGNETPKTKPFVQPASALFQQNPSATNPFAPKESPFVNFKATSRLDQAQSTNPWSPPQSTPPSSIFERPSNSNSGNSASSGPGESKRALPTFSWATTAPTTSGDPLSSRRDDGHTGQVGDTEVSASSQAPLPSLYSGTSSLFQPKEDASRGVYMSSNPTKKAGGALSAQDVDPVPCGRSQGSVPGSSNIHSLSNFPPPNPPPTESNNVPSAPIKSTLSPPLLNQATSTVTTTSTTPFPSQPTLSTIDNSQAKPLSIPGAASFKISSKSSPPLKETTKNPPSLLNTQSSKKPTGLDPRVRALDQLAEIMVTEDGGLLQQFVEYSVAHIIRSSLSKYQDEKSWARSREYRTVLLAKKFFARWKTNSWNLGLKRRAKERRRNLAFTMREAKQYSPAHSSHNTRFSSLKAQPEVDQTSLSSLHTGFSPPALNLKSKRQPMPTHLLQEGRSLLASATAASNKRKRDESDSEATSEERTGSIRTHKRCSTLAASSMSTKPHTNCRSIVRRSMDSKRLGDGSLLGDTLMRQARRLATNTRQDTTQTDYFTLKAMGVNPDTSLVPRTKTMSRSPFESNAAPFGQSKPESPLPNGSQESVKVAESTRGDDDEALFASIRAVRQTLAESTSWFQSERQSLERSMTPQSQSSPSKAETAAEKRLRGLRERGHTPTRAEVRQSSMTDKSFLPNGIWNRPGDWQSLRNGTQEAAEDAQGVAVAPKRMGSAAFIQQGRGNGMVNGASGSSSRQDSPSQQQGSSVEDAIEL